MGHRSPPSLSKIPFALPRTPPTSQAAARTTLADAKRDSVTPNAGHRTPDTGQAETQIPIQRPEAAVPTRGLDAFFIDTGVRHIDAAEKNSAAEMKRPEAAPPRCGFAAFFIDAGVQPIDVAEKNSGVDMKRPGAAPCMRVELPTRETDRNLAPCAPDAFARSRKLPPSQGDFDE